MPKKKADSKPDPDLKEVQEWNKKVRERMKRAREAEHAASTGKEIRGNG